MRIPRRSAQSEMNGNVQKTVRRCSDDAGNRISQASESDDIGNRRPTPTVLKTAPQLAVALETAFVEQQETQPLITRLVRRLKALTLGQIPIPRPQQGEELSNALQILNNLKTQGFAQHPELESQLEEAQQRLLNTTP